MSNHIYSRPQEYYEDLYDKHTVESCRNWIRLILEHDMPKDAKKLSESEQKRLTHMLIELPLYFRKGDRYLKRRETVEEWMEKDKERDDFVASHPTPTAYCPGCTTPMELMVNELDWIDDDRDLRMLYMYRCEPCKEKKAFYSDGEPYVSKNDFCPKCNEKWNQKHIKAKDKITTKYSCPNCGYIDEYVLELNHREEKEPEDPNFEEDRKRFCLSEKEGEDYRRFKTVDYPQLKALSDDMKDKEVHKEVYEQALKVKKLTIAELSDLLAKGLAKSDFMGLVITNTEVKRDLIVSFTIQDTKHGRQEGYSKSNLKVAINRLIDGTNWKIMSDGIGYKLGLLSGRLRGVDDQEVIYHELKGDLGENQILGANGEIIYL